MKSFIGNSSSVRGWALLLALLLGAGMMISACGEEEVPAPTTPTPPPAPPPAPEPEPEPTPEPPATPTGLHVDETTATSITWHWNAVEGALGYAVQVSMDETFDDTDQIAITQETSFTATPVPPETSVYLRVRSGTGTPEALAAALATGSLEGLLLSDWSTHVTGMTTAVPLPPAPANLRIKERGSDFIEWQWDATEGVAGYQSQFSPTATFPDGSAGRAWHDADETTRKVSNLDAESDGYLRVRTYGGTQAEPNFGAWSAASMSTTSEPPPAVPLAAPTDLEVADRSDDTITLEWGRVRNAGSYEVEQREPGDDWDDANCGGGTNVVEDEECVAIGLTAGTDYDFQIRAVPSDTDRYETSDWSEAAETRTLGDAPRQPTAPTPGGMGTLNARWESTPTSITWLWDRTGEGRYDFVVRDIPWNDSDNPCRGATWPADGVDGNDSPQTSHTVTGITAGDEDVRLLCVRPHDEEDDVSFAWAASAPATPAPKAFGDQPAKDTDGDDVDDTTTALEWAAGFQVRGGFNFEFKVALDPVRDNDIGTTGSIQSVCNDGKTFVDSDSDEDYEHADIELTGDPQDFTGHLLCTRYRNATGSSEWTAPDNNAKAYSRPAKPPRPTRDSLDEETGTTTVQWAVGTRNVRNVPRLNAGFNARTITHRVYKGAVDADNNPITNRRVSISTPKASVCAADTVTDDDYEVTANLAGTVLGNDNRGVVISPTAFNRPGADADGATTNQKLGDLRVYLCVQATDTNTGTGPWEVSAATTVKQQPPSN